MIRHALYIVYLIVISVAAFAMLSAFVGSIIMLIVEMVKQSKRDADRLRELEIKEDERWRES